MCVKIIEIRQNIQIVLISQTINNLITKIIFLEFNGASDSNYRTIKIMQTT